MTKLRTVITENEAGTLELYLEKEEIQQRFKIVPMSVLKKAIEKGLEKGINITTIAESIGLAYVTVWKQYEKMKSQDKDCIKATNKIEISREIVLETVAKMKSKSKIELAFLLEKKVGKFISYSTINRILREQEITL